MSPTRGGTAALTKHTQEHSPFKSRKASIVTIRLIHMPLIAPHRGTMWPLLLTCVAAASAVTPGPHGTEHAASTVAVPSVTMTSHGVVVSTDDGEVRVCVVCLCMRCVHCTFLIAIGYSLPRVLWWWRVVESTCVVGWVLGRCKNHQRQPDIVCKILSSRSCFTVCRCVERSSVQ
jgi:hypothetical protein